MFNQQKHEVFVNAFIF